MRVTFLGTGTSTGVPIVGCRCRVCTSPNPRNHRLRQSVAIEENGKHFLIDTTPDLRLQLLRHPIPRLDFLLFTHSHADHLMGLDDVRPFNFRQQETIHAFASPMTVKAIRRTFSYIWDVHSQIGGGKPQLTLHEIDGAFTLRRNRHRSHPGGARRLDDPRISHRQLRVHHRHERSAAGVDSPARRGRDPGAGRPAARAAPPDALHRSGGHRLRAGDRGGDDVPHSPDPRRRPRRVRGHAPRGIRLAYDGLVLGRSESRAAHA